jgi:beta-1,4-glucosyltransferase
MFQESSSDLTNVFIANDGVALNIASKLVHGKSFSDNLNGTDFSPYFLKNSPDKLKIFLLGAKPEVVVKAKEYLSVNFPNHVVVGIKDGYFDRSQSMSIVDTINHAQADILFVAMGNPVQEKWILDHQDLINASYIFAVGALFDFWSGNKIRAPKLVQKLRLEWLFRLCQEPRRLIKRYSVDILRFLYISIKYTKRT